MDHFITFAGIIDFQILILVKSERNEVKKKKNKKEKKVFLSFISESEKLLILS